MRKTLTELASYLKEILVPETDETYEIASEFKVIAPEAEIRISVSAFRRFLSRLFDELIIAGATYDTPKKVAHEYENRTTLSGYYPFLHSLNLLLIRMGYHGVLAQDRRSLTCAGNIFDERLSTPKTLECLRFLEGFGMQIEGIDLNDKKQNLLGVKALHITYSDNPAMLTGMKVMAAYEVEHGTLLNQDVLLRCDRRALTGHELDAACVLHDTISPLPKEIQEFALQLHQRYLDKGLTCTVEIKGFFIYIRYCYKRKDVWGFNASLNNGYHLNMKPVKTEEYQDTIRTFDPFLQELIQRGYGCGRKRDIGHCDGGCRGLPIPLDASALAMRDDIVTFIDQEVLHLK